MSFWNQIRNIFKTAATSSPNQPVIHEVIDRSEAEIADFEKWKESYGKQRFQDWLREEHLNYMVNPENRGEAIDFLNTPSTKGFVIYFHKTRYPRREVIHFFDFLKEQVLAIGYKPSLSDFRIYNQKNWVEETARHYLKPPTNLRNFNKEKFDQRFGNVMIELISRDEKVHLLKFSATVYQDRMYKKGDDFNDLMKELYL